MCFIKETPTHTSLKCTLLTRSKFPQSLSQGININSQDGLVSTQRRECEEDWCSTPSSYQLWSILWSDRGFSFVDNNISHQFLGSRMQDYPHNEVTYSRLPQVVHFAPSPPQSPTMALSHERPGWIFFPKIIFLLFNDWENSVKNIEQNIWKNSIW